jgi:hypothetical protein
MLYRMTSVFAIRRWPHWASGRPNCPIAIRHHIDGGLRQRMPSDVDRLTVAL